MTRAADLHAVACPSCGAGLDVLGGGRVTTHVCGFCGSMLDAGAGYRVLAKYDGMHRPASPFRLGHQGTVSGVAQTVIGTVGWSERHGGRGWSWVDHLLYSPTHGYSWLTVEDGHLMWTRRLRDMPIPWLTVATVEASENRPGITFGGHFRYYETSTAEVTFVEGEFTYAIALRDCSTVVTVMSETAQLHFGQSETERELERSVWLPQTDTWASFGIAPQDRPRLTAVHPLQPFDPGPDAGFLTTVSAGFAVASLVLLMGLWATVERPVVPPTTIPLTDLPAGITIPVTAAHRPVSIVMAADVDNSWLEVDLELVGPDDDPVFELVRGIERYSGVEGGESWSEGSGTSEIVFRPDQPGDYRLTFSAGSADVEPGYYGSIATKLTVSAREGVVAGLWLLAAAAGFALLAVSTSIRGLLHHRARWKGSDWEDED